MASILKFRDNIPEDIAKRFKDIMIFPQTLKPTLNLDSDDIPIAHVYTLEDGIEGYELASIRYFVTDCVFLNSFIDNVFKKLE